MRHRRTRLGLLLLTLAVGSANACSSQAEGQRCDTLSGNADCESGLVCTKITQIAPVTSMDGGTVRAPATYAAAVCCPPPSSRVAATTAACQSVSTGAATEPGIPETDAGTGGSSGAGGAAGSESGGAGGTDAGRADAGGAGGGDAGGSAGLDASAGAGP